MAEWPAPRSVSLGAAFGSNAYDDPTGLTYDQISPGADEGDPGDLLAGVRVTRGRIDDQSETQPTRIKFGLRDEGGKYSPRNVSGEHYGELRRGTWVQFALDGGFGAQPLATAAVPSWSPRRRGPGIDEQMPIQALGFLDVLSRDTQLASPMRRAILGLSDPTQLAVDYWPMEDGSQASQFASAVSGGLPMTVTDADVASVDDLPGSAALVAFTATTALSATVTGTFPLPGDAWSVAWMAKFASLPGSATTLMDVHTTGGDAVRWVVSLNGSTLTITSLTAAGATVHSATAGTVVAGEWLSFFFVALTGFGGALGLEVWSSTGTNVAVLLDTGLTDAGVPTSVSVPASSALADMAMGHLFVSLAAAAPSYLTSSPTALEAYAGETAADRVDRTLAELDISGGTDGMITDETAVMGAQPIASTYQILRECEAADDGLLFEDRAGALRFSPNFLRYNDGTSAFFDFTIGDQPGDVTDLIPIDDDRDLYNIVTVAQPDGTFAVAEQIDGPVGSDTTTGVGPRRMPPQTRNLYLASDLPIHAGWLLRKGTVDRPRYQVVIDFFSVIPESAFGLPLLELGDRIRISGVDPDHEGPDYLDLIIEGETIDFDANRLLVTWHCEPFEPWRVQQLTETPPDDDLLDGWLIPDWFKQRAAQTTSSTSWAADCWPRMTTDADDMPCRITLAGEEAAITAVATTAATYVAVGTADHDDNAAVTPGDYAGGAVGDWVVVVAGSRDTTSPTLAITDPNYTYDLLGQQQGGLYVWAAFRAASTPAPTITPTGGAAGDTVSAQVFGLRGMPITGSPSDWVLDFIGQTNASAQDIAFGRLEPGGYAGRVILVVGRKSDDWTSASISGPLEITETTSTSGNDQSLYAARRIDTTPTEVAAASITATGGGAAVSDSLVIALQGGYQTFTVTRGVNGVAKPHAVGDEIELLDPLVLSL